MCVPSKWLFFGDMCVVLHECVYVHMCGSFLFTYFYLHGIVNDFGTCVVAKVYFVGMC